MVGDANDETEDDRTFTQSMTRTVICGKDNVDVGAADQGVIIQYASGEMGNEMPLPQQAVCMSARFFFFLRRCGSTKALCLACE